MREILFRAKRADNGEWIYGNLFIPDNPDKPVKNGNKIFEGDILAFNNDKLICIYKNGCFGFMFKGCFVTFKNFCRTNFEVIGNIHDNPELLEQGV